jgi:catalase
MATPTPATSASQQQLFESAVDALNTLFGSHPGFRAAHAKGVLCEGTFTPAATAPSVSRAPHFHDSVPVTVRFSDATGIPNIPDTDPNANPRGIAVRFHLPGGGDSDIVAHSFNGFPVGTVEEFVGLLHAIAATKADSPKPTPVEVFVSTRPNAMKFAVGTGSMLVPTSFATLSFFGVNAFKFTNADGIARHARYQIHPVNSEARASAVAGPPAPDFLFDELKNRLAQGAFEYKLVAQIAQPGDPVHDASISWPDERPLVELGTIKVSSRMADNDANQRRLIFDPIHLADGIELSADPLPAARSAIYGISYARRNAQR